MHITFVKKVLMNGALCAQCEAVSKQLIADNLIGSINQISIADARDQQSPGMVLTKQHDVKQVPFFLVEDHTGVTVFDVYSEFKQFLDR